MVLTRTENKYKEVHEEYDTNVFTGYGMNYIVYWSLGLFVRCSIYYKPEIRYVLKDKWYPEMINVEINDISQKD